MKRILVLTGATALMLSPTIGVSLATGAEPGTPGAANCKGQTTAWVAHGFGGQVEATGIGNVADLLGLTVEDVQATIDDFCATEAE